MNKKGSMWTLFVVALVALGLMATVSLQNNVTGEATGVHIPSLPKVTPPSPAPSAPHPRPVIVDRDVTVYDNTDDYVVYDSPKLTTYDCTTAREIRKIDDKLGIVSSANLLSILSACDSYNI